MTPSRKRPSLVDATLRIFDMSLGQMLWSRRSAFLALLTGGPILLACAIRVLLAVTPARLPMINGQRMSGTAVFGLIVWLMYLRFVVPVLGVFYGTSLIADEVEDKTITYLFTRPIPRSAVVFGKYLAFLACTVLLLLPSATLVYFLLTPLGGGRLGQDFPSLLSDLGMLAAGLAAYGALFALVGAIFRRPLVVGLVFTFGWEPGVLIFPGYLKRATIAFYLQALVPHAMPNEESLVSSLLQFFNEIPTLGTSLASLAVITLTALWLAGRAVATREYVLEQ
ncbi:MAG TPA: ABC transporter permease [Vicinamibacterales bacterium]|jgi:ABC-type transport system involved in multi-copper enzyme maturation permease subunit|nr:ABC transporter permease [Vicinamibacterales bacterium]